MEPTSIDLNADLGEGMGDDEAMLRIVTSANVACGGHAGDEASMRAVLDVARDRDVKIGAHISYPDRAGFGRRTLALEPSALRAALDEQLRSLADVAATVGAALVYVKPHGALYNDLADDPVLAAVVVGVITYFDPRLWFLTLPGSAGVEAAEAAGLRSVREGYVDRGYTPDGRLVPRSLPGALLNHADAVAQAVRLAESGAVDSLCVHGDTPGAVAMAGAVREALAAGGIALRSFIDRGQPPA